MNRFLVNIFIFIGLMMALMSPVLAQNSILKPEKIDEFNQNINNLAAETDYSTEENLDVIIGRVVRTVLSVIGSVFLIFMFLAGWKWMRAGGNEEAVSKAKKQISSLVIGLVVILAAYAASYWILNALVGPSGLLAE